MIHTVKGFSVVNEEEVDVFLKFSCFFYDPIERKKESKVAQSCPTLCDPVNCSPPGSFVLGIFQARILEWVAISFSNA